MRGDAATTTHRTGATLGGCLTMAVLALCVGWTVPEMPFLSQMVSDLTGEPLYSVALVQEGLVHDTSAWNGRTVWVEGIATRALVRHCPYPTATCVTQVPLLLDVGNRHLQLPLAPGLPDSLRSWLRGVPLISVLVPPPQIVRWGVQARYAVTLRAEASRACPACTVAVLRDAALGP
jgi:hypothetical protein